MDLTGKLPEIEDDDLNMAKLISKEMSSPVKHKNIIGSQVPTYKKGKNTTQPLSPRNQAKEDKAVTKKRYKSKFHSLTLPNDKALFTEQDTSLPRIGKFITGSGPSRASPGEEMEMFMKDELSLPLTKSKVNESKGSIPASQKSDFVKYQFLNMMDPQYFNPRFKEAYRIFQKIGKEKIRVKHSPPPQSSLPKRSALKEVLDQFKQNSIMDEDLQVAIPKKGYAGFKTAEQLASVIDKQIRKHEPAGASCSAMASLSLILQQQERGKPFIVHRRASSPTERGDDKFQIEIDQVDDLPSSPQDGMRGATFKFKGGKLSFANRERQPLIGKSSALPPRISPSKSGMGLTVRSSRLHRDPSRALSIKSSSVYNDSLRGYNFTKLSNYGSEDRHHQSFEAASKRDWNMLYHKRKDSISLLKKGTGTGGGRIQLHETHNPSQEDQSPQDAHYTSITLQNTSLLEDPVVTKIESKIYRGTYKDPLRKEEEQTVKEQLDTEQKEEEEGKDKDPLALHLQSIQTTTSTRKKPTASPFPGFYGQKPAVNKKSKKNQRETGRKFVPIDKLNQMEKFLKRFKKILLKHKHTPERTKDKKKAQLKVMKYYNQHFLTKIILDSQFQEILQELNLFTNIERDEDLVKKVLEEVHLRREMLIEEEYRKGEEQKQELFRLEAEEEEKKKNSPIKIQESIGRPSPSRLTQEVLSRTSSRRDQKSTRMESRIMTPRSQRSSSKRSFRANSETRPVQSQFAKETEPRPQSTLRSSPEVEEEDDPEDSELKAKDWKQIGRNKNLQFAVLDRIMMECEEIESPPESYETQIKDNKWKCELMIKDISWSIECLFDILSGTITENADLFKLRKEKGRNEWRNWLNFLNQDMINDMDEEKWSQSFFVRKLGRQKVWKPKARLFGRKFEKQNPTFAR